MKGTVAVRGQRPDLVGMQEVHDFQLEQVLAAVPQYARLGVGREDGEAAGEFSPILYRKDRFRVLESGTFWLSETPEKPGSKSWKTACTRVCTWGRFRDNRTDRTFYMFNTHLDHVSQEAREKGIALILQRIEQRSKRDPVFLTGDFNAGEDNTAINKVTKTNLRDSFRVLKPDAKPAGTFNSWKGKTDGAKIDYVFVPEGMRVLEAEILHDNKDGRYPSDHYPVTAIVEWK
jgi:endonuclease/exonuclease/phosphatase family metal-dependent hydrolase